METIYLGVILVGLLHGLEPAHGWPVAMVYSSRKKNPLLSGMVSSAILSLAHLISSVAVVIAYLLLSSFFNFDAQWTKYLAAGLLLVLAVRFFTEKPDMAKQHGHTHNNGEVLDHSHEHEHPRRLKHAHQHDHQARAIMSLKGLAVFALVLGFAHEEEFALLALVAGGLDGLVLMIVYGLSVSASLIGITLVGIKAYERLRPRLEKYDRYLPKIGAVVLAAMAVLIVVI